MLQTTHYIQQSLSALLLFALLLPAQAEINITRGTASVTVEHQDREVTVSRNQDPRGVAAAPWNRTGRNCPPFCVQPMVAAPGVATVGISEVVEFMKNDLAVDAGMVIDARTEEWFEKGTIPGSVNIPFTHLNRKHGGDDFTLSTAFEQFGAEEREGGWDFSNAKNLVLWCNGWWCGQSPAAIRGLLNEGYPAEKLFYFRGGMQNWQLYGLTVTH